MVIDADLCVAAYTPMGATSQANSYDNNAAPLNGMADGTHDLTVGSAPAWNVANGWTFDGSANYLISDIEPVDFLDGASESSIIIRFSDMTLPATGIGVVAGYWDADGTSWLVGLDTGITGYWHCGAYTSNEIQALFTTGFAGEQAYIDGIYATAMIGGGVIADYPVYIGRNGKNAGGFWGGKIQAMAIYQTILTGQQMSALHIAIMALPDYADG